MIRLYLTSLLLHTERQVFSFVILFIPHTTGPCPESTDHTPAVVALSAVPDIVVLLLAVAILTIGLLYTSESVMSEYVQVCVCMCLHTYV